MRSALLCVFFALIVKKEGSRAYPDTDFKPIPIPLDEWNYEKREARVGTLHETIKTDQPPTVAAVPAHYWEDALRHSVYLTLVRDKIDQLIAKGSVVSPNSAPDPHASKEVDDHDLWEKIKKAPFDRIKEIEYPLFGDVTILARGRLLEENNGFRFAEDERSTEKCSDDKCAEGVKAFWSVKRVRQRDTETSPGRYHYELTFSVNSQLPKKQKRPYENPVRTFTVRENTPDVIVGTPQEYPGHQLTRPQVPRPQRAVWLHRNIVPAPYHSQARYYHQGLDRIFSSFFSDDETHVDPPPRYKPHPYMPPPSMMPQYSKASYVGLPSEQHHQKRLMPYPYKPGIYKYPRPPLPPPPSHVQHHYIDVDAMVQNPYTGPFTDHRHISPSNIVKTTRPAVLPTPPSVMHNTLSQNLTLDFYNNKTNISENITKEPEVSTVYKPHSRPRPTPMKISYFSDHVRPPVYNAPPGVFVTMDKKPFKPMPPLKLMHPSKPAKRPVDFRPSPQVLDVQQFSDPEPSLDSAFRPIYMKFNDTEDKEITESTYSNKHENKHPRKQTSKKPPKKHENIKSQRVTTSAPDIITVHDGFDEDNDTMQWANVLSAFTKTTPMSSQKEKKKAFDSSTEPMPASEENITTKKPFTTTEVIAKKIATTTTTTTSPKKRRTRPPHKFVKPEKIKKHKRITTTTKAPEKSNGKKSSDLTPQASSAATGPTKTWQPKNSTTSTVATTTTTATSTTQKPPTTSTQPASTTKALPQSTTAIIESTAKSTLLKSKNRFRQSTLMIKGTSVKHDRWNVTPSSEKKQVNIPAGKSPPRRKGSNFQGYMSSSTAKYWESEDDSLRDQKYYSEFMPETSKRTEASTNAITTPKPTQPSYEEIADHYDIINDSTSAYTQNQDEESDEDEDIEVKVNNEDEEDSEDHSEFIFGLTSTTPNERTNEIIDEELQTVTEPPIVTTSHSVPKNKTKCKKKKNQHLAPTQATTEEAESTTTTTTIATTTKSSSGLDIIDEILGSFYDDPTEKPTNVKPLELDEEESENHEKYLQIDEDFEDFLDNLGERQRHKHSDEKDDIEYEDDEKEPVLDDDVSPFDNDDVNESSRNSSDKDYDDYHERSYSLLELMAME